MAETRRQFLGRSTAVIVAGTMATGKVWGANDRIGVGVIGFHGRGGDHIKGFSESKNSEVVALCDVDQDVLNAGVDQLAKSTNKKPKGYTDMRDLLDNKEVDAISTATPNHWHSLVAVWGCMAGKDVYVEKPISHTIWEGRQVANAAKKYGRIVQHGTQGRSSEKWMQTMEYMHGGIIGNVFMARALCFKRRDSIGHHEPSDPPKNLNWDLWQGPAPARPFSKSYVHYNWHWFWDFGNGDIGNQGVHQMDIAVWGINKGLPVKVQCMGGRFGYEDDGETPNTQTATFTYGDGSMLVFEVRGRSTNDEAGTKVGDLFYGSNGYFAQGGGETSYQFYDNDGKPIAVEPKKYDSLDHFENFLRAVRTRDEKLCPATALQGHISSAHCHLANIAYRTGRTLEFDPQTERFVSDDEANALVKQNYRKGFEVPEIAV
jgi:predicted dehydrogenase